MYNIRSVSLMFLFFISVMGVMSRYTVAADDNTPVAVKIPPPIEGIEPSYGNNPQALEKDNISILTANSEQYEFSVELAKTPAQQRTGMMFRKSVPKMTGMLFLFNNEKERQFWMKNTLVPLDIIFIRKDGVITHIHHHAKENSLEFIRSNGPAYAVLEIGAGVSRDLKINIGDRIDYAEFNQSEQTE